MSAGAQAIIDILEVYQWSCHIAKYSDIYKKCFTCVLPKCSKMTFRDCGLTCHKPCHVRVDNHCLQTSLPNMELWAHHQIYQFLSIWNIPMIPSMTWCTIHDITNKIFFLCCFSRYRGEFGLKIKDVSCILYKMSRMRYLSMFQLVKTTLWTELRIAGSSIVKIPRLNHLRSDQLTLSVITMHLCINELWVKYVILLITHTTQKTSPTESPQGIFNVSWWLPQDQPNQV